MAHPRLASLAGTLVLVVGCRSTVAPATRPPNPGRPSPSSAGPRPAPLVDPVAEPVRVEDFVLLALERNPALRAAEESVSAVAARSDQVTALPDPVLMVTPIGDLAQTAAGEVTWMAGLRQRLPVRGQRAARGRRVEHEVDAARARLAEARTRVVREVRRAYWNRYHYLRAFHVVETERGLMEQFLRIAEARYAAGSVAQEDVLRAQVEIADLEQRAVTLRQQLFSACGQLNRLLDRDPDTPISPPGEPVDWTLEEPREALLERARAENPALARLRSEVAAADEGLHLAELARWPDVTLGLDYAAVDDGGLAPSADGQDQWSIGLALELPLRRARRRAAEEEARHAVRMASAQLAGEEAQLAFEVHDVLARLDAEQQRIDLFRGAILPAARQAVEAAESGYRAGGVDFQTLVDAWRKLLELELALHEGRARREQELAELEEVVGGVVRTVPVETEEQR
jgi:cobalt-zinc-cadmium efflux system outer membrane protein